MYTYRMSLRGKVLHVAHHSNRCTIHLGRPCVGHVCDTYWSRLDRGSVRLKNYTRLRCRSVRVRREEHELRPPPVHPCRIPDFLPCLKVHFCLQGVTGTSFAQVVVCTCGRCTCSRKLLLMIGLIGLALLGLSPPMRPWSSSTQCNADCRIASAQAPPPLSSRRALLLQSAAAAAWLAGGAATPALAAVSLDSER